MRINKSLKIFIFISFFLHLLFIFISYRGISKHPKDGPFIEIDLINLKKSETKIKTSQKIKAKKEAKNIFSDEIVEFKRVPDTNKIKRDVLSENYTGEYEVSINSFIRMIREKIEKVKNYPEFARTNNYTGEVHLRFSIASSGEAGEIMLIKSSGFSVLDESAIATIKEASPFLPFPDRLNSNEILVSLPIIFDLR